MFTDDSERTESELRAAIRAALGKDMEFSIITTGRWEMTGLVANHYSKGRVFLAGDAAHQLPPTRGGFGANTGIDDVYNLAWKLEFVLRGLSSESLLATYSEERQPIGTLRHDQTFARPDYARFLNGRKIENAVLYQDAAMELGQLMRSSAVIGATSSLPPAATPEEWAGQPGVRAPHAWIQHEDRKISTVDLFTRGFVVMAKDAAWRAAAEAASKKTGIPVKAFVVGEDVRFEEEEAFERLFGVKTSGASLIRPDGVVGWRAVERSPHHEEELLHAVAQISSAVKGKPIF
jgi:hypothetical protein